MTADLSDGCGNGNGWLVHGMPVSRIAQQLASDVVEPAIPAEAETETVTLLCRFHFTSVYCKHRANIEIGSFLATTHRLSLRMLHYVSRHASLRGLQVLL
jgi:hypothetical protein